TLAHNETSTGVLSPLEQIAQVVREESDALLYVDAVSSLAGARVEAEAWGIDFLFTGAQKSMALPPGLAFFTVSGRLLERAEATPNRGYYTDLVRWRTKHLGSSTLTTPAVSQVFALDVQLNRMLEEGMEARWQRHLALRARTEEWAASRGFRYASQADGASPTVSCLEPPAGVEAPKLVAALAARDLVIGTGYGTWKPKTIRIGHMGEVRMDDLETLLAAIDEVVEEIRA
ncbi:MAG: aminotransferase class V-fold PLP-dependent enzyme, partial [Acidobacteriota bacterium]